MELIWEGKSNNVQRPAPRAEQRGGDGPSRLVLADARDTALMFGAPGWGVPALVYMDPPFGSGAPRMESAHHARGGRASYRDPDARDPRYLSLLHETFTLLSRSLDAEANVVVHLDFRAAPMARLLLDETFGPRALRNEIVWNYHSGGRATRALSRKHDVLLWYTRARKPRFFPDSAGVPRNLCPVCRAPRKKWNHLRRETDERGRIFRTVRSSGKEYRYYDDDPVPPTDVWSDIGHLQQKDPERTGYATQKPLRLLERIITLFSRPGDVVADPFCGSATTAKAAHELGRAFIAGDVLPSAMKTAELRLSGIPFERWRLHAQGT